MISSFLSEQPVVEWYFTDTQQEKGLHRSLTNLDEDKIVVNVIKDKSTSKPKAERIMTRKQVYTSPDTLIGSRTMEDLFKIVTSPQSSSPIERVIIIDRPEMKSSDKSIPSTSQTTQSSFYSHIPPVVYQPPKIYTVVPSHIFVTTTYIPNTITYYPSVYFY